ncbi:hypothetical protein PVAND_014159 [Polypedilum vanderplanki]|uniref:Sensory neuron membrane protein 1 n=1 Tax=Polypedilum vanderplanki TaxID=319348 RepID=A0A9J6CSL8_POLVA|nr:hypothetical protein PVAND_014159 [Polypedilum vanderplanki]
MAALTFLTKFNPKIIALISICVMIVTSTIGFYLFPMLIKSNIDGLNLKKDSDIRKIWEKTPFPLTFKVYIFNLTNPLEVVEGKMPHVQQIGPYVFDEWKSKNVLSENEQDDTITSELVSTYIFRPDLTKNLTGDEIVTVPHPILMGATIGAQRDRAPLLPIIVQAFQQIFLPEGTPFLNVKVMDLLFNGVGIDCDREEMEAGIVCGQLPTEKGINKVNETYFTISMFGDKNGTSAGKFKINRGIKDIKKLGEILTVDDKSEGTAYKGECNKIQGTDGTIFAPYHAKSDVFWSYSPIFCRSLGPIYKFDASYNSVPTAVYSINFDDLKSDPKMHCYCRQQDPQKCPPKGTVDVYTCMGVPLIISKPHFLDADKKLLTGVKGLKPSRKDHDNNLQFEMITGTPVSVKNRIMFSMQIEKVEEFDLMKNMEPVILPFFWIEESLDLDKKLTNVMRFGLYLTSTIMSVIKYGGLLLGMIGLIYAGYRMFDVKSGKVTMPPPPSIQNPISARSLQSALDNQKY